MLIDTHLPVQTNLGNQSQLIVDILHKGGKFLLSDGLDAFDKQEGDMSGEEHNLTALGH
jgi:hypothetical protein